MNTEILTALCIFAFVSSVTPGPNNLMLMTSAANFGIWTNSQRITTAVQTPANWPVDLQGLPGDEETAFDDPVDCHFGSRGEQVALHRAVDFNAISGDEQVIVYNLTRLNDDHIIAAKFGGLNWAG